MYPNEFISNLFSTNKNFEDYARIEKDNKKEKNLVRNIELNRCSIKFSEGQAAEREKFGEPLSRFNFVNRGKEVVRLLADSFQDSTGYRGARTLCRPVSPGIELAIYRATRAIKRLRTRDYLADLPRNPFLRGVLYISNAPRSFQRR